jgi:hypothetical protein
VLRSHARILQHPFALSLQGALLDSCWEEQRGKWLHITLNLRSLEKTHSELIQSEGAIRERIEGHYVPMRLDFFRVSELKMSDLFLRLIDLSPNDPTRTINDLLCWQPPERQDPFYLFYMQEADNIRFFARRAAYSKLSQEASPVTLERDWCPPPPMSGRLVPKPKKLHKRFGGDPVTVQIDRRIYHRRLFIGGLDIQANERPQVDVVLNLGETPSKWAHDEQEYPEDRWDPKGEGSEGMSLDVIREEANEVIEHLKKHKRVLVHCAAGMNRSSTICCAILILLEGLTAEQALKRVREQHPWARPDSRHWLKLRWLAQTSE